MKMTRQKTTKYEVEVPNNLKGFKDWEFSSGTTTGKDFKKFGKLFKKFVKDNIPEGSELVKFSKGHYILSGFIEKGNNFVYFSISDVRHFKNEWSSNILIRKADGVNDFTGGHNHYTNLENFKKEVRKLLD